MPATVDYIETLKSTLGHGDSTEHSHRPALQAYVESFADKFIATNEPRRSRSGAPDYDVKIKGSIALSIGKIEAKDIGTELVPIEKDSQRDSPRTREGKQLRRYRFAYENLILTNYLDFRWYVHGELRLALSLGSAKANKVVAANDREIAAAEGLLTQFLASSPLQIKSAKRLAERLAQLSVLIHDVIRQSIDAGTLTDETTGIYQAFKDTLVADLNDDQFADMLAQTIAYGLFAARVEHDGSKDTFTRIVAAKFVPRTNPFVRNLFNYIAGSGLDDEPHAGIVDDIAQLLDNTDIKRVLRDFGAQSRDPIVHFYETFLSEYSPELRSVRGVYYTPLPVVGFIVRAIDDVLKSHFSLPDGVGDISKTANNSEHRVLFLDPAAGTGTFLYETVRLIRDRFVASSKSGLWTPYVHDHLLPRLFGFELMMAPYVIAHLKLALQLAAKDLPETKRASLAYDFAKSERIGVYMTNALDPGDAHSVLPLGKFISDEANAASEVKSTKPIMVVLGNPPYYGQSANVSTRRERIVRPTKTKKATKAPKGKQQFRTVPTAIGKLMKTYYEVDGSPLKERNPKWLQDDYVKFIRLGQARIDQTGQGVLAYITNHTYLDAPTFRGMRQSLLSTFNDIYVIDLHGSLRRRERCPDGSPDENVFDQIQQGVCVAVFVKTDASDALATVHHIDCWGSRESKNTWLDSSALSAITDWQAFTPEGPFYSFRPEDAATREEWLAGHRLIDIFPIYSTGLVTSRDSLAINTRQLRLKSTLAEFLDLTKPHETVRAKFFPGAPRTRKDGRVILPGDTESWDLPTQRTKLANASLDDFYTTITYRPFDQRAILYHDELLERSRHDVMRHMLDDDNLALVSARSNKSPNQDQFFVSRHITEAKTGEASTQSFMAPLWLKTDSDKGQLVFTDDKVPNIADDFAQALVQQLGLSLISEPRGDLSSTVGAEDVLHYVYAMTYSRAYRLRYADFLRSDYPRILLTTDPSLFTQLCEIGEQLVDVHTSRSASSQGPATAPTPGSNKVEAIPPSSRWTAPTADGELGSIALNSAGAKTGGPQTVHGVAEDVWRYEIGGHQVLKKWLDARVGDTLTFDELTHLINTINALDATLRLQDDIDDTITTWPIP